MEITLSIIGTAGRKDDADRLSKQHFDAMCTIAIGVIDECARINYPITTLVSGGAAWADHVAAKLYLDNKVPNLRLYLPCAFDGGSYYDNGKKGIENPGGTCNYYHHKFRRLTNINSLTQLLIAKNRGAELINVEKGFYARNAMVAKSDFLLAMTFGNGAEVKAGGTAHTVKCYLDRVKNEGFFDKSFHYDLNSGKLFFGCILPKESDIKSDVPIKKVKKSKLVQFFNSQKPTSS